MFLIMKCGWQKNAYMSNYKLKYIEDQKIEKRKLFIFLILTNSINKSFLIIKLKKNSKKSPKRRKFYFNNLIEISFGSPIILNK